MLLTAAPAISVILAFAVFAASSQVSRTIEKLVYKWAPLVFLAPGEKFYPSGVNEFLENVLAIPLGDVSSVVSDVYERQDAFQAGEASNEVGVEFQKADPRGKGFVSEADPGKLVLNEKYYAWNLPTDMTPPKTPNTVCKAPNCVQKIAKVKKRLTENAHPFNDYVGVPRVMYSSRKRSMSPQTRYRSNRQVFLRKPKTFVSLPGGVASEKWSLVTKESVDDLLKNSTSFLYGKRPDEQPVPIYTVIVPCKNNVTAKWPIFHVTYWMFYPYNQGKAVCTVDMGRFGAWPIPRVNDYCFGKVKEFGNHVGDWEHLTLYFEGSSHPQKMYVSSHEVGAIYKFRNGQFVFDTWELRKGIMPIRPPYFPTKVMLASPGFRPILFAASGSHGLWAAPGKHKFSRLPRLHDTVGFGVPWRTWQQLVTVHYGTRPGLSSDQESPNWIQYRGRWGNPRSQCLPAASLNICQLTDGPTGIPLKKMHFSCPVR